VGARADEKYLSVATFRRGGVAVPTATGIVALDDGRVGFWTSSPAGKTKRLRNDPRVTLQPNDSRGRVKPAPCSPSWRSADGPDLAAIQAKVRAEHGVMVPISKLLNTHGHVGKGSVPYGDGGVVITLDQWEWRDQWGWLTR
jgi:PPOX class probable F420-dependent enzyme